MIQPAEGMGSSKEKQDGKDEEEVPDARSNSLQGGCGGDGDGTNHGPSLLRESQPTHHSAPKQSTSNREVPWSTDQLLLPFPLIA